MDKWKTHLINGLRSGLFFGGGLVVGILLSMLFFRVATLDIIAGVIPLPRIILGLLVAFVVVGLGAAIGGFAGGYRLPMVNRARGRFGYGWRSAWSFGIPFSLLVFLGIVAVSLLNFYNVEETPTQSYMTIFAVVGVLFGLIYSALFGLVSVRRQGYWRNLVMTGIGFGLGGALLGAGVWLAVYNFVAGQSFLDEALWLMLGIFLFGLVGGLFIGYLFSHMSEEEPKELRPLTPLRLGIRVAAGVAVVAIVISACRPLREEIRNFLTPQQSFLSSVFEPITIGTRWMEPAAFAGEITPDPALSAAGSRLALAWSDGQEIFLQPGEWDASASAARWGPATNVSESDSASGQPAVAVRPDGTAHAVWVENGTEIVYAGCDSSGCTDPIPVSAGGAACETGEASHPAIAVSDQGEVMVAWETGADNLPFAAWASAESPASGSQGCVFEGGREGDVIGSPRLAAASDGSFWLVFGPEGGQSGDIGGSNYAGSAWDTDYPNFGLGRWPEVYIDPQGRAHVAYCSSSDQVQFQDFEAREEGAVSSVPCASRPEIGMDGEGDLNVVWFADSVESVTGSINNTPVLYESHQQEGNWTPPAVVSQTGAATQPSMEAAGDGSLHMAWGVQTDQSHSGLYASLVPYSCDPAGLSDLERIVYEIATDERYRTADNPVPFCQNRIDQLVHAPNPDPAFSEQPASENGPFDVVAELVQSAGYEVLFMTMWYDQDETGEGLSPGAVLGRAVKQLYDQVKANPEDYPRGMTVRILLDNPPEIATLSFGAQLWNPLEDLHNAGLRELVNEEIGWKVEVANFRGAWPHGHTKAVIVDGARMIVAGFNYQHAHLETDHPSGKGSGRWDLGTKVSGPVAQDAVRVFDDMWAGATLRECSSFEAEAESAWKSSCRDSMAVVSHVPEVLKYYIPGDDSVAFSMFRSEKRDEADNQIVETMNAAQESLEIVQVNFGMDVNCNLNYLYDICGYGEASRWGRAIVQAAQNGAQVRVLVKLAPAEGVENAVTVDILTEELERLGLEDRVEFRSFGTDAVHYKGVLVDGEVLLVGSQNFHYSAFDRNGGLTEYTLATSNPEAIDEFKKLFEFHWEQAVPLE